jgi:hypothetical protein
MEAMRDAIINGDLSAYADGFLGRYQNALGVR